MNVAILLQRSAAAYPHAPAVGEGRLKVRDYLDLMRRAQMIASGLRALPPGSRVAIVAPNHQEYLEQLLGIWWAGMVAVPVNYKLHESEVEYILQHCDAQVVFRGPESVTAGGFWDSPPVPRAPSDPAWIFYTSGTTGRPKGATLTHGNLMAMVAAYLSSVSPIDPGDSMVHACALSHGSGLYALPHVARAACNVVLEAGRYDPHQAAELLWHWRGSVTFGPPTALLPIADEMPHWERLGCGTAKALIFGGSPLYVEDLQRAYRRTGGCVAQIYGQGETPCTITALTRHWYWRNMHNKAKLVSVGLPQHGIEIRTANDLVVSGTVAVEDTQPIGEVLVRGPTVMAGYWNDPEATAAALQGGWLHTGDIGRIDADGFLTLLDRSKDVIISGGFNVYPREVEEVLLRHPLVAECSVIGRKSERWGEEVVAFVVTRCPPANEAEAKALREALDGLCLSSIARYKRPREYRFLSSLPKSGYDKVLKRELRDMVDA